MEIGELKKLLKWIDCVCVRACVLERLAILASLTMGLTPLEGRCQEALITLSRYSITLVK